MKLITQSEWARRRGFSRQYVNKLINQGKIRLVDGMIAEDQAQSQITPVNSVINSHRDPSLPLYRTCESTYKNTGNINELLARARLKNEIEKGKILEAKAKAEISKLESAEKVRKSAFVKARIVRDKVLDVADRVSETFATIDDSSRIREILEKELRNATEEFDGGLDDEI